MRMASKLSMFTVLLISLGVVLTACGGGGGGDSSSGTSDTCEMTAGTWRTTEKIDATDCGEGTYTEYNTYIVTQSGCDIIVEDSYGGSYSGSINGSTISWTGSFPDDGGTTTVNSLILTVSGDTISGHASWTWTDGVDSCSGTAQISGTKQ